MTRAPTTTDVPRGSGLTLGLPWQGVTTARTRRGELVAVHVLRPSTAARRRRLRRRAEACSDLADERLVGVRGVYDGDGEHHGDGEGAALVVVTDLVSGPRLGDVAATDGGLSAAGVHRLLHDLATGLAALHDRGLRHGALSPSAVVLRPERAVLTDVLACSGPAANLPRAPERRGTDAGAATAASDVWELAGLIAWALTCGSRTRVHDLDAEVREVLEAASRPDPVARPSAARLAAVAGRAGPDGVPEGGHVWGRVAVDVWDVDDAVQEADRQVVLRAPTLPVTRRRGGPRSFGWAAGGLALGLVLAALPAVDEPRPGGAVADDRAPTLEAVFARRDRALETGSVVALSRAVRPGSPAWGRDVALLAAVRRDGIDLDGVRTLVRPAERAASGGETGPAEVLVSQAAHRRTVDGTTTVLGPQPPSCLAVRVLPTPSGPRLTDWTACE